jgi:hypothetical protein
VRIAHRLRSWLEAGEQPSIQLRLRRDLDHGAPESAEVRRLRRLVPRSGWAKEILNLVLPGGQWTSPGTTSRELYLPKYIATNWRLIVLSDLGVTRSVPGVARSAELLMARESGARGGLGGSGSEVCFTGNAVRMLVRFGYGDDPRVQRAVDWLVRHQKRDGGWHCFRSARGTLDGWEALAAFAAIAPPERSSAVERAIRKGAEFYLDRGLVHEGRRPYPPWSRLHYPNHYYYDFLVGLDMLTALGYGDDRRMGEALDLLEARRNPDGTWNLDAAHPDIPPEESYQPRTPIYPFVLEYPGRPSRWITVSALTVLDRSGRL